MKLFLNLYIGNGKIFKKRVMLMKKVKERFILNVLMRFFKINFLRDCQDMGCLQKGFLIF